MKASGVEVKGGGRGVPFRSPLILRLSGGSNREALSFFRGLTGATSLAPEAAAWAAAWAAARSSPRLSHWLESHPRMGPMIRDWRRGGVVRRRAKWMATLTMAASALLMAGFVRPWWVPGLASAVMAVVAAWLWQRPEAPPP